MTAHRPTGEVAEELWQRLLAEPWPLPREALPPGTALVGGAVRDGLLGSLERQPDLDVVVPGDALALAGQLANVANAQVLVQETGDALIFLHQVAPGGASRSYGIEAARLAGVPAAVVLRARQVLGRIEANSVVQVNQDEPSGADGALAA